ncbi:MAG: AMP-binding protein [Desulfopila sp.]
MRDFTVYDLFVRNARIFSDKTAVLAHSATLTFAELLQQSERLAAELIEQGCAQGDRIAVLAMNHPGFFVLVGAVARMGGILVPLNWRLAEQELAYILRDCQPRLLFCDPGQEQRSQQIAEPLKIPVISLETLVADGQVETTTTDLSPLPRDGNSPFCLLYTAAVEGVPRGATLSHANLLGANLQVIVSMGLGADDAHLTMLPLFHITGLNLALAVMQQGGCNVMMAKFKEDEVLRLSRQHHITLWGSFPPMLNRMIEAIDQSEQQPDSLRYVVGIDGPDSIAAFERRCPARFWILYGQAETSGFVTFAPASDRPGTAGRQGPLSIFALVDENDNPVGAGETGEIVVRGPLVFQGYWRQDGLNARTFRNHWHHTGDLGQLDAAGYLIFKGRKPEKELIKPGGENVYPAEVEAVILQHDAIEAVSVIGVADPRFGEGVKAVCIVKPGHRLTATELIEFVGARIARYKKPGYVQFVDTLPMKGEVIDRQMVKKLYGQAAQPAAS